MNFRIRWTKDTFYAAMLVFSCFCSGLRIEIGSIGISVTHLIFPIIFLHMLAHSRKDAGKIPIPVDSVSLLLYFIWAISIVSTLLFSGFPTRSITGGINFTFFILLFLFSHWMIKAVEPYQLMKLLLSSAKLSAWIGIIFLLVALVTNETNVGATLDHISSGNIAGINKPIPSIRSFSYEPNLFGIITASVLAIYFAIYLTWDKSKQTLTTILFLGIALILSYTRSAFIGLVLSVGVMIIVSARRSAIIKTFQVGLFTALSLVIIISILPEGNTFKKAITYKLGSGLFDVSKGTAIPRLISINESLKGFEIHPVIGNGIFSANNVFVNPHTRESTGTAGPVGWLNGLFIQALHDTGLLGLLGWGLFFSLLLYWNYLVYRKIPHSKERSIILGFMGGNFVILVGSQASSLVWIAFPYVYWAINLVLLKNYQNQFNGKTNEDRN